MPLSPPALAPVSGLLRACLPWVALAACAAPPAGEVPEDVFGHCIYTNRFADQEECKELRGAGWDDDTARAACDAEGAALAPGPCPYDATMGACVMPGDDATRVVQLVVPAADPPDASACPGNERGCELFGGGTFVPGTVCGGDVPFDADDVYDPDNYYVPETLECREPLAGEPPGASGGQVCTWQQMSGCTEEGRAYEDYASCDVVRTQRPYGPVPPDSAPAPDPRMRDATYASEVAWVKGQLESCACVCCHKDSITPEGASIWDTEHASDVENGNFVDSFSPWGLAFAARAFDSSLLGAYTAADNNGFSRVVAGLPSTDEPRMKRFFEDELAARGYSIADFASEPPAPAVFASQADYVPTACEDGEGVDAEGVLHWSGGRARYLWVLEEGSVNPGVPPNLDTPAGTLWKIATVPPAVPAKTGEVRYGEVPPGHLEDVPAAPLVEGRTYLLFAMADIGVPMTRCLFTR